MTPYRCCFLDSQGIPVPAAAMIDADGIDHAIERALEMLAQRSAFTGFEIREDDWILHRYVRPRRDF